MLTIVQLSKKIRAHDRTHWSFMQHYVDGIRFNEIGGKYDIYVESKIEYDVTCPEIWLQCHYLSG